MKLAARVCECRVVCVCNRLSEVQSPAYIRTLQIGRKAKTVNKMLKEKKRSERLGKMSPQERDNF